MRIPHLCLLALCLVQAAAATAEAQLISSSRGLSYPAHGLWNGFNSHLNVVECSNFGGETAVLSLSVYTGSGDLLGQLPVQLGPRGTVHTILNVLPIAANYGLYRIDADPSSQGAEASVRCWTVIYALSAAGQLVYAYTLPVIEPQRGPTAGLFNSFDPEGRGEPTQNWLSIANPGGASFRATIELYDQSGAPLPSVPLPELLALDRFDVGLGHAAGQTAGAYRIVPEDPDAPYHAVLTAYGTRGGVAYFAYPLYSSITGCPSEPLFASTVGNALNWMQVASMGQTVETVNIEYRSSAGALLGSEQRVLAPREQQHIFLNDLFGPSGIGVVQVNCPGGVSTPLLLQSVFYLRDLGGAISWAYSTQQRGLSAVAGEVTAAPVNSFLGMITWQRAFENGLQATDIRARLNTFDNINERTLLAGLPAGGSGDLPLHALFGADSIGSVITDITLDSGTHTAEVLRVLGTAEGAVRGVFNVPALPLVSAAPQLTLVPVAAGLAAPVSLANAGDGSNRLFIVELAGKIRALAPSGVVTDFLDIQERVTTGGERGLLGLAFHPDYESNGRFFVHYSGDDGDTTISEFLVSVDPNVADAASERIVLTFPQPSFGNHKGGQIAFGPDGFLYIALGDGGSGGDPLNNGQTLSTLLGKILRIDVDSAIPYAVPPDNPFVGQGGVRPEIWAYGFRNPWRFSFDRLNGRLFAGDVGQQTVEEIDIVTGGGNYGWRFMEGTRCFNPATNCPTAGLLLPIHEYGRDQGISIIGGFVYRGDPANPGYGRYFFGDFGSGRIWALTELSNGQWQRTELADTGFSIVSFGEGEDGELFMSELNGTVHRLQIE